MHIDEISPEDYPVSENFKIELRQTEHFGKHLYFVDDKASLTASFNNWDHADSIIKNFKEKNIPTGSKEDPFIDLEQNFRLCIFKDGDYVHILQGWDPSEDIYFIWFRVDYEKYISEWKRIIELSKNSCVSFLSIEDALKADPLRVKELKLSYRGYDSFPSDIFKFKNIEKLEISGGRIYEIPGEIGELKKLNFIAFSGICLDKLPKEMENLTGLKSLYLNNNKFGLFPEEVFKIKSLEHLDLCDNIRISNIPDDICCLSNLKKLWLNRNDLSSIPENIGKLENLLLLSISGNHIKELPESLCNLEKLENLYCTNSNLGKLPEKLFNLKSIRVFQVSSSNLPKSEIERGKTILGKAFII